MRYFSQVSRQRKYKFIAVLIIVLISLLFFYLIDDFRYQLNSEITFVNSKIVEINYKANKTLNDYYQLIKLKSEKVLLVPLNSLLGNEIRLFDLLVGIFLSLLIFEKLFFKSHTELKDYIKIFSACLLKCIVLKKRYIKSFGNIHFNYKKYLTGFILLLLLSNPSEQHHENEMKFYHYDADSASVSRWNFYLFSITKWKPDPFNGEVEIAGFGVLGQVFIF